TGGERAVRTGPRLSLDGPFLGPYIDCDLSVHKKWGRCEGGRTFNESLSQDTGTVARGDMSQRIEVVRSCSRMRLLGVVLAMTVAPALAQDGTCAAGGGTANAVGLVLGTQPPGACPTLDANGDGVVTIEEMVRTVPGGVPIARLASRSSVPSGQASV